MGYIAYLCRVDTRVMGIRVERRVDILDAMHGYMCSCIPEGSVLVFDKPVVYRASPHAPSVVIERVVVGDDFRYDRQLLALICQRLRRLK